MTRMLTISCAMLLWSAALATAQEKPTTPDKPKPTAVPDKETLHKKFIEQMANVKLIDQFTMTGKDDDKPKKEEYTVLSVQKLAEGDYWLIKSRVKYGETDVTIPMPLEVKWAGDTPVITLTETTIPGLGTFSARVVIYNDAYAGMWQHGKVGGQLFGKIEKVKAEEKVPEKK